MMSLLLDPAGYGTTSRTGFTGYSCADAKPATISPSESHAIRPAFILPPRANVTLTRRD